MASAAAGGFNLKADWPLLAFGLLAVLGFVLIAGGSGGSSAPSAVTTGGLSGSQYASLISSENQTAAALQEAQLQAQTQGQAASENDITSLIGEVLSNNASASQNALEEQLAEYQAYEQELGTAFGDTTSLSATSAQVAAQEEIAQLSASVANQNALYKLLGGIPSSASQLVTAFG